MIGELAANWCRKSVSFVAGVRWYARGTRLFPTAKGPSGRRGSGGDSDDSGTAERLAEEQQHTGETTQQLIENAVSAGTKPETGKKRLFPYAKGPSGKHGSSEGPSDDPGTTEILAEEQPHTGETPQQLIENAVSAGTKPGAPYPKNSNLRQSQAKFSYRPVCDPRQTSIILFPGQGTQFVGMGKQLLEYPRVKVMYEHASSILGYDLLKLCLDGPKSSLSETQYCQPAVLVTSLACLEKLKHLNPDAASQCVAAAGFSVGEIAALTFAGTFSFESAVRLVKYRAEAMQAASDLTASGMMTIFYGPDSSIKSACALAKEHCTSLGLENIDCRIANYLYPHCKVIAGNTQALDFVEKHAADFAIRRIKRLSVSGAFHTDLMQPAVQVMGKLLAKMHLTDPQVAVHSNVDGKRYRNKKHVVKQLPVQIVKPVRWEQTLHILYERNDGQAFPVTYECGPGSSLKAILKMVNAKAAASCTSLAV